MTTFWPFQRGEARRVQHDALAGVDAPLGAQRGDALGRDLRRIEQASSTPR